MTLEVGPDVSAKSGLVSISVSERPVVTINPLLQVDSAPCVNLTGVIICPGHSGPVHCIAGVTPPWQWTVGPVPGSTVTIRNITDVLLFN